jgi:citrate synthase
MPLLLDIALVVDNITRTDGFCTSRKLYASADLYGAPLYTALGFEMDIIHAMASLSRLPGLLGHWHESMKGSTLPWRPEPQFFQPQF